MSYSKNTSTSTNTSMPILAQEAKTIQSVPIWQHHVAAIVIFLVWLELMMLVGRFPIFGLYVQMFTKGLLLAYKTFAFPSENILHCSCC